MSIDNNHRRYRKQYKPDRCPETGLQRYRERQDASHALRDAKFSRAVAAINGREGTWTVIRAFKCEGCLGFHLTSQPESVITSPKYDNNR